MASKQQVSGMRGVYLVAAELSAKGFVVSLTSREAKGADLLVTDQDCKRAFTVQVKSDKRGAFWLLREVLVSSTHVYVFVRFRDLRSGTKPPEFYIVPSEIVQLVHKNTGGNWGSVSRKDIGEYRDRWKEVFEGGERS